MGRKTVSRRCLSCGLEFQAKLDQVKAGKGKYCSNSCKSIAGGRARAVSPNRPDHSGENNPNYKGEARLSAYEYKVRSEARFPEKAKARDLLFTALRRGKMVRMPCEVCGDPNSHGHHEDYTKPYDVRWLCKTHHNEAHGL